MTLPRSTLLIPLLCFTFSADTLFAARTELISKNSAGEIGESRSTNPSISADARYVVYQSSAKNLVTDKTSSYTDIFLHDRSTGETSRVSISSAGTEGDGNSSEPEIAGDGNSIAFMSQASDLVASDTEGFEDVFIHNRSDGSTSRVSISSDGTAGNGNSGSPDLSFAGRYVVFQSDADNLVADDDNDSTDIFRHDLVTGETTRVSLDFFDQEADNDSFEPAITDDGRYVSFVSDAALTPCDDNGKSDVFVRDMVGGTTTLASATYYGCVANDRSTHQSISADGRFVTFSSYASNLLELPEEDTNHFQDVYLRDLVNETTERISVSSSGEEGDDRSVGYGGNISADGRYVTFASPATNLVNDDGNEKYDIFARDLQGKTTTRESVSHYWEEGSGNAEQAVISADGRYIVFDSESSELVGGDTNGTWDIFIRDYLWPGPLVTKLDPPTGDFLGGTLVTVTGSNFQTGAGVTIDGVAALNVAIINATTITCITPPHVVGSVELKVTNPDGNAWIYPVGHGFNGYTYRSMAMPWMFLLL